MEALTLPERELSIREASIELGISEHTIRRRIESNRMRSRKDERGKVWVIIGDNDYVPHYCRYAQEAETLRIENETLREHVVDLRAQVEDAREMIRYFRSRLEQAESKDRGALGGVSRIRASIPEEDDPERRRGR